MFELPIVNDIWASLRRMPLWVQVWMFVILVPVNILPIIEIFQPGGTLIALLSIGGLLPNLFLLLRDRGFSKLMSLSHLILWTPLCVMLILRSAQAPDSMTLILWLVLVVDVVSLCFDIPDFIRWMRGERTIS